MCEAIKYSDNYSSTECLEDTPFTKAIRNILIRGTPASQKSVVTPLKAKANVQDAILELS